MKRETSPPPNCWAAMLWFTTRSAQHSVNGSFLPPSCKAKFDAWTQKFLSCSSSVNADAVVRNYGNSRLGRATFPSSQRSIQSCPAGQLHNSKEVGRTKTKDLSSYFLERGCTTAE